MNILLFLGVLVTLIVVHELGHFLAAKFFNIKVEEFGIGYPPLAWRMGKIGETVYTLNWIPFGGFVKIFGENLGEDVPKEEQKRALVTQKYWKQAVVFVAGVAFNVLFAWILFSANFMMGYPVAIDEATLESAEQRAQATLAVSRVLPSSPAGLAGLTPGDELISMTVRGATTEHLTPSSITSLVSNNPGEAIQVAYIRDSEERQTEVIPSHGVIEDKQATPAIGIEMILFTQEKQSPLRAVLSGAKRTYDATVMIAVGTGAFIVSAVTGSANWQTVAGPVGIVSLVGDASALGIMHLINFTAMISLNLAIINMIPVPALDGGRLLFVMIESITRRKIPHSVASTMNFFGFALIILLMLVVTYHDIVKLVL